MSARQTFTRSSKSVKPNLQRSDHSQVPGTSSDFHSGTPPAPASSCRQTGCNDDGMFNLLFLFLSFILAQRCAAADYHERLTLRPLPPDSLLASFNFRSNASLPSFHQQNFQYFPRSLGQILQHTSTEELHLRFSTGRWDAEEWGARPWRGAKEGGTGVELWAWIEAADEET